MNDWIEEEFGEVNLGDQRLNERLRLILTRKAQKPQASISASCQGNKEVVAASRFFNNELISQEKILAPHRACILERIRTHECTQVLLIQDTTECDFSTHKKLSGTGPLGSPERRGYFAHSHLVVTPERLPLGLWDTHFYAREDTAHGKAAQRKSRPIEQKESGRWVEGYLQACTLAAELSGCEVLSVSDREGDLYEVFAAYTQRRAEGLPLAQFLIRSKHDRCLEPFDQPGSQENPSPDKIRSRLAASPVLGTVKFHVPETEQLKKVKENRRRIKRTAREVEQEVRATRIRLKPPARQIGDALPVVTLTVVEAREINPPAGEEPLVWVLLTSLPAENFAEASKLLELYLCRWEIELFHKVLKSGCKLEELQQRHDFSLKSTMLICMVIAWRILYTMRLGRSGADLPCEVVFDPSEWQAVVVILKGRAALLSPPCLGEMIRLIAQLGGYLGRKNDPPPGIKCLWIGMARMADFALAWEAFNSAPASPF